ncbi:MAG: DEAD/DEAH box helicase [Gammaproteobacteria bacterium]|nr:MAG: DEAD/DEAH box helicase [Gammaproteobacteria bacterium]
MSDANSTVLFDSFNILPEIKKSLLEFGYETPTPIQSQCIPHIINGEDIIGMAQTGTGKTAAFALPLLSKINLSDRSPQLLVLTPTRELAIQVSEALQKYARHMKGFHIIPIYGGQSYEIQFKHLKRGVHVVVGTPGRVMDHIKRETLSLANISMFVLDEADEMLRMGFIEDIEWVMSHLPQQRQTALFSATMPKEIRKVAKRYMQSPQEINIASKTATADTIQQRYWLTDQRNKLEVLARLLEFEQTDGVIVFVRTKTATVELAEKLEARGYSSEALNGDIPQKMRERVIERLKNGAVDIVIATDVAARGLDVNRISHVINYDIPYDTESYIHRIGRTGRAGKSGEAILLVTPRERRILHQIEKVTKKTIDQLELPSIDDINRLRVSNFKDSVTSQVRLDKKDPYRKIIQEMVKDTDLSLEDIASALARLMHKGDSLFLADKPLKKIKQKTENTSDKNSSKKHNKQDNRPVDSYLSETNPGQAQPLKEYPEIEMERFILEVGTKNKVRPGNIVGAIANEAEIESCYIGNIEIHKHFSTVDLPVGMPKEILKTLKKTRVCGQEIKIRRP